MNIQNIGSEVANVAFTAINDLEKFAIWGAYKIQVGFENYIIPVVKSMWTSLAANLRVFSRLLFSGPVYPLGIAAVLFAGGLAAFKIADHHAYEDDIVSKTAWKALGIASFVGATALTSLGIVTIIA